MKKCIYCTYLCFLHTSDIYIFTVIFTDREASIYNELTEY